MEEENLIKEKRIIEKAADEEMVGPITHDVRSNLMMPFTLFAPPVFDLSYPKRKERWCERPVEVRTDPKIGRNDPCPCGSGNKYKKCCLNKDPPIDRSPGL